MRLKTYFVRHPLPSIVVKRARSNNSIKIQAGFGDVIRDLFDFEKWAPRSSQAWRLGQEPVNRSPTNEKSTQQPAISENDVEVLNQRLASARRSTDSFDQISVDDELRKEGNLEESVQSFTESSDEEFSDALNSRIFEIAASVVNNDNDSDSNSTETTSSNEALTGSYLIELIEAKYGEKFDIGFVRRDIPGKVLITANIYHAYVGQRSFPMSEEEYNEKLEGVASLLNIWGKAPTVISFLKSPVAPRRGLPSRPIVGNAVSIPLDLSPEQISEWFGR